MSANNFMDIATLLEPNDAWAVRWTFVADMNRDGSITVTDVWLWIKWAFFAPGDWLLLMLMMHAPSFAHFFEMTTAMLYGWWSFFISSLFWFSFLPAAYK